MKSTLTRVWGVTRVLLRLWLASLVLSAVALAVSGLVAARNLTTIGAYLRSGEGYAPSALPMKLVRPLWWLGANQPGIQVVRIVPRAEWIPQTLSAASASWGAVSALADQSLELSRVADAGVFQTDGSLNVSTIAAANEISRTMLDEVTQLENTIAFLETNRGPLWQHPSRSAMVNDLWRAQSAARDGLRAINALQPLLLSSTPKKVFVGITNPAEARGVHGIIGQYAIVEISRRGVTVRELDSNLALRDPLTLPASLSAGYEDFYGRNNPEWQNMTLSPFVDDAAEQIVAAWEASRRERIDAVLLMDVVSLARLATIKGETYMTAQGRLLETSQAVSDYLSNGVYLEFPEDNIQRKTFQTQLGKQMVNNVLRGMRDVRSTTTPLATSFLEGRLALWVQSDSSNQSNLATVIGLDSGELAPSAVVVRLNNFSGNKMDFYLEPSLVSKECDGVHDITLTMRNVAPWREELPDYILRRLDPIGGDPASFVGLAVTVGQNWEINQWTETEIAIESRVIFEEWGERLRVWLEIPIGESREIRLVLVPKSGATGLPRFDLAPLSRLWDVQYNGCFNSP